MIEFPLLFYWLEIGVMRQMDEIGMRSFTDLLTRRNR